DRIGQRLGDRRRELRPDLLVADALHAVAEPVVEVGAGELLDQLVGDVVGESAAWDVVAFVVAVAVDVVAEVDALDDDLDVHRNVLSELADEGCCAGSTAPACRRGPAAWCRATARWRKAACTPGTRSGHRRGRSARAAAGRAPAAGPSLRAARPASGRAGRRGPARSVPGRRRRIRGSGRGPV